MGGSDGRMKSGQRGYRAPGRRVDGAVLVKGGQVSSGTAKPAHGSCEAGGPDKELDRAPTVSRLLWNLRGELARMLNAFLGKVGWFKQGIMLPDKDLAGVVPYRALYCPLSYLPALCFTVIK